MIVAGNLRLRRLAMDDCRSLAALADNERVCRYLSQFPSPYTLADAEAWIRRTAAEEVPLNFGIEHERELAGVCGLEVSDPPEKAWLGYWLGERFWGRGLATTVVGLMLAYASGEMGLKYLEATVHPDNLASRKVLAKNGFSVRSSRPGSQPIEDRLIMSLELVVRP